ncbi:hypothetical protein SH661x_001677 [Planctomicrobium sp. SH661]|uniref:hypothetical protein n=1 Tax=Planctomicrobium sp. SH661 TaxID=3448124 RepID=UPI003F5C5E8F
MHSEPQHLPCQLSKDMNSTDPKQLRELLSAEQERIEEAVREWKAWWTEMKQMGYPNFCELELYLARIKERLREHFEHEEQSGRLESLARSGSSDPQMHAQLLHEHAEILSRLNRLTDSLQMSHRSDFSWCSACQELDEILEELRSHEQREVDLANAAAASP